MAVYFIQAGPGGPVKIGFSENPQQRLAQVQVDSPVPCVLLGVLPGGEAEEAELHERFRLLWIRGEWFEPGADLLEIVPPLEAKPARVNPTPCLARAIEALGGPSEFMAAIDISPRMDIFNWLASNYPGSGELIFSPAGGRQIYRGRPHMYGEPTRGDHWDHIHWGMFDRGGFLQPGWNMAYNGTGRPEPVGHDLLGGGGGPTIVVHVHGTATAADGQAVVDALRRWQQRNGPVPVKVSA